MRKFVWAALVSTVIIPGALADESVAGHWHANIGSGVTINMDVTPNGGWDSKTSQKSRVIKQMKGTYTQEASKEGTGTLVFTPTEASVQKGAVHTETDKYELADGGKTLKLTSDGDTMVFEKRPH